MKIFDTFTSADGYEIYWLHEQNETALLPEDLYYDKDYFMEECESIVKSGQCYLNYIPDDEDFDAMLENWEIENSLK